MRAEDQGNELKAEVQQQAGAEGGQETGTFGEPMSRRKMLAVLGMGAAAVAGAAVLGRPLMAEASGTNPLQTTIAELRDGTTAAVAGQVYYVTDPGKEGEFYHDSNDNASLDNTGTLIVSTIGKRFKRATGNASNQVYNIRWFGATGDGTTDDSAAFQAAINLVEAINDPGNGAGGMVYIPPGTYNVTGLTVQRHYVKIAGDGMQASILVNKHASNKMFDIQLDGNASNTLSSLEFRDFMIKNSVTRTNGDYPLLYAKKLTNSVFANLTLLNANQYISGSSYNGSGVKIEDSFTLTFDNCKFRSFYKGYGLNLPNGTLNGGNFHLKDCLFLNCAHGVLFGTAGTNISNSILLSNCKFVANQGGDYSADFVKYARSTASANVTASSSVTLASGTNFAANTAVLVGSANRLTPAYITAVSGNVLTLDRPVTCTAGDSVIQGTVGIVSAWCAQEVRVNVGHFEGCDIGLLGSNGKGLITIDSSHIGNNSNGVLIDDQIQSMTVSNSRFFAYDPSAVNPNWAGIRITKMTDNNNLILLENNEFSTGGSYINYTGLEIVNQTAQTPKVRILNRKDGVKHQGDFPYAFTGHASFGGAYNNSHIVLGTYHLWVDTDGKLRISDGPPAGDRAGTVVGAQS